MFTDKFLYHQPLYRQHLELKQSGITLSRTTLTNLCSNGIELLRPIYDAQWVSILESATILKAEKSEPDLAKYWIDQVKILYYYEEEIRKQNLILRIWR